MLVTIYLYQRTIFIPSKRAHQKGKTYKCQNLPPDREWSTFSQKRK